ncbi:MAG: V-type ATP synthase subunit I [Ruminococcaceae bacterium]|nr:V-type ATP synthase subunit I [Oscillospiraceae bacterium]
MIVPMKKITLYAMKRERKPLLRQLQKTGLMMIIDETEGAKRDDNLKHSEADRARVGEALKFAGGFAQIKKSPIAAEKDKVDYDFLMAQSTADNETVDRLLWIREKLQINEQNLISINEKADALTPWLDMNVSFDEIEDTKLSKVKTGYIPERHMSKIPEIEQAGGVVGVYSSGKPGVAVMIVAHCSESNAVFEAAQQLGFTEVHLPKEPFTAAERHRELTLEAEEISKETDELKAEAETLSKKIEELQLLHDRESTRVKLNEVSFAETDNVFYVEGWTRADKVDELEKAVKKVTDLAYVESRDPNDDEKPPTLTENNKIISQFEAITDMFSRPDPRDVVDPNTVMGIWYWIIFGMMMGDAGYGLMMIVLVGGFKLLTKNNGKLVNIIFYSGFSTVFWGIMFGSYFGESLFPAVILSPLDDIMTTLGICLGIGVLHIFSGIAMKMYIDFKEGRPWDAILDQLTSIVLVTGLLMLFSEKLKSVGKILSIISVAVIILTGGRTKKGIGKFTGGFLVLYNVLAGLGGDILSYARILALMLSGGIVAMVMNILAGMVMPNANSGVFGWIIGLISGILIYIIGHVFNLVLNLLSAYVHDSRLQYLEFFGKFYEGGGYAFKPLSPDTKYVAVEEKKEAEQ